MRLLKPSATAASLSEVSMAFVARNIAPEVLSIQVLPTNVGLAANPPVPVDPNIELTGLDPALFGIPNVTAPPRRVYQRGARRCNGRPRTVTAINWSMTSYYKEVNDSDFKLLRRELTDNFLTIDGQSLADGRYIFKVVARDTPSNPVIRRLVRRKDNGTDRYRQHSAGGHLNRRSADYWR